MHIRADNKRLTCRIKGLVALLGIGFSGMICPVYAAFPGFSSYTIDRVGSKMGQTALADVDRDGDLDWIVGEANHSQSRIWWWEYQRPDKWIRHTLGRGNTDVGGTAHDLNGDGDIVTGQAWYENADGSGLRWKAHQNISFGEKHRYGIALKTWVIDLDGDGDPDVVQAEADNPDGRVAWFENDGRGDWTRHMIKDKGDQQDFHTLVVTDFDGDGDPDVFSGGGPLSARERHTCYIWENAAGLSKRPTSETWIEHIVARKPCHEAVAGDVDGDGDIDICTKPWSTGNEHVFLMNLKIR